MEQLLGYFKVKNKHIREWEVRVVDNCYNKETRVFVCKRTLSWGTLCVNIMNMDHLCSRGKTRLSKIIYEIKSPRNIVFNRKTHKICLFSVIFVPQLAHIWMWKSSFYCSTFCPSVCLGSPSLCFLANVSIISFTSIIGPVEVSWHIIWIN